MKYYSDIEQGTSEWQELKRGRIGGTRAKGLMTKGDTLFYDLLAEISEPFDENDSDQYTSEEMQYGIFLEPEARGELSKYIGVELFECGYITNTMELLGLSPDGISADKKIMCEIKCPQAKRHLMTCLRDEIPLDNIHQCIHYFTVSDELERLYFCSYRPQSYKQIFVKELTRESLVNVGTEAKPVMRTISDQVSLSKIEALALQDQLNKSIEKLKF